MRNSHELDRRAFLRGAVTGASALAVSRRAHAAVSADAAAIGTQIEKHHDEAVKRLQDWIAHPTIAAEGRAVNEGADLMMQLAREAGFGSVTKIPTDGVPGVFATLDAGAPKTLGLYFMYDVKQVDPKEWSSPPFTAALVDKPELG